MEPQTFNSSEILKVSYKCASGYELVGNETIYCDPQSGQWNSDAPTCHPVESSPLEDVRDESGNLAHWIGVTVGALAAFAALGYLIYVVRRE